MTLDPTIFVALINALALIAVTVIGVRLRADVREVKTDVRKVEIATNSLTERLVATTKTEAHAAGVKEERERPK